MKKDNQVSDAVSEVFLKEKAGMKGWKTWQARIEGNNMIPETSLKGALLIIW